MPRKDAPSGPISAQAQQDLVSDGIENFELPKSIVTKIAKSVLPDNAKLQKETVLSLVKGSTVFINYLAATAHDVAVSKQHKSISASDVLKALEMIQFGDLVDKLQSDLLVYRVNTKNAKNDEKTTSAPPTKKTPANSSTSISISIPYTGASTSASASASALASASAPVPVPALASAKGKAKGKEKEKDLGAPFTSVPLAHTRYLPQMQLRPQADVYMQSGEEEGEGQQEVMEVDQDRDGTPEQELDQDQDLDAEDLDHEDQEEGDDVGEGEGEGDDVDEGVSDGVDEEEEEDKEGEEADDAMEVEVEDAESRGSPNHANESESVSVAVSVL